MMRQIESNRRRGTGVWLAIVTLVASACSVPRPDPGQAPATEPGERPVAGERYAIDSGSSELVVYVYRAGALARLGHNHIIASRALEGCAWVPGDLADGRAELAFRPADMSIDDAALRAAAGEDFASDVDDDARRGTRDNMLSSDLLDAANHPVVRIRAENYSIGPAGETMTITITLRGREHRLDVPVTVAHDGTTLRVHGEATIGHADIGLTPFSVMLGALSVREEFLVAWDVVASRGRNFSATSVPACQATSTQQPLSSTSRLPDDADTV